MFLRRVDRSLPEEGGAVVENLILENISLCSRDAVATVQINREEKLNALNSKVLDELCCAFEMIGRDSSLRVVILTGAGSRAFAAGADLSEVTEKHTIEELRNYYKLFNKLYAAIGEIPQPVIARVNGYAFGGGCLLALASDLIVATMKSSFSQPEVNFGFTGGAALLPRLVGKHKAAEITMLGRPFSAEEAYRMGLVNSLVEESDLDGRVSDVCRTLLKKDALALAMIKRIIRNSFEVGLASANLYEDECSTVCLHRPESNQAILNFLKRK